MFEERAKSVVKVLCAFVNNNAGGLSLDLKYQVLLSTLYHNSGILLQ